MINKIVVPLDGSELAEQILGSCISPAKKLGSSLTLVYAVDTKGLREHGQGDLTVHADQFAAREEEVVYAAATNGRGEGEFKVYVDQLVAREEAAAKAYLGKQAAEIAAQGLPTTTKVVVGRPSEAVVAYAEEIGADLIAMSTHGRAGLDRWRMGSVTDEMLHLTNKPMLIFHPQRSGQTPTEFRTILLPVDGSALAEQAFPLVESLAQQLGLTIQPVRVVSTAALAFAGPLPYSGEELTFDMMTALEEEATDYLNKTVQRFRAKNLKCEPLLVRGDPATELVDIVAKTPGVITVITTHGRSGLGRFVLGSVADKVIRSSGAPVIVIRPTES